MLRPTPSARVLNQCRHRSAPFRCPAPPCATFIILLLTLILAACGGGGGSASSPGPPGGGVPGPDTDFLSAADAMNVVQAAAVAADSPGMVIAVADRLGNVLAVYGDSAALAATSPGNFGVSYRNDELAVSLARTGAFFSNDQAPLSSRTVRFISGIHFPPGVDFASNAALYGIENTNRGCTLSTNFNANKAIPPALPLHGGSGLGIATGKPDVNDSVQYPDAVNPGGVPVFRGTSGGELLGGIGVAGVPSDVAEFAAFSGAAAAGFSPVPQPLPAPGVVFIDGIALPFVNQTSRPAGVGPGTFNPSLFEVGPNPSPEPSPQPEGDLVGPTGSADGLLTADDVTNMLNNAQGTASITRAQIRLPLGQRTEMVIAVSDLAGNIIGLRRMHDSTIFSIDVAATKARNVIYFSGPTRTAADLTGVPMGIAVTNRTISFGAQPFFPPGINGSAPGPFFNVYTDDVANPCSQGFQPPTANQSGIVFFPGSVPLYKIVNGAVTLVGGLGVSGDGVEQDDYVTAGGADGGSSPDAAQCLAAGVGASGAGSQCFEAPAAMRADQVFITNVRLPYLKFPRNPTF